VFLYLDEAHSFFTLEPLGRAHAIGLEGEIDFMLVTLSKALGGSGAIFLSSADTRERLVNTARSLIYSTALPSASVAWTNFILEQDFSARRSNLKANIDFMGLSETQICPFVAGENEATLALAARLRDEGYFVAAIRPPTVPAHTARLRISLRGDVEQASLERLKEILDENRVA
jgi:8-amino-7-oxononanoate synthase